MEKRTIESFPEVAEVKRVYGALANYFQVPVGSARGVSYDFDIRSFSDMYNLKSVHVHHCLKILELQGLLSMTDSIDMHSRVHITVKNEELYEFQVRNPILDHVVKTILRSYGGAFDDYVIINEKEVALRCGITEEELKSHLNLLNSLKIISYISANDSPQLVWLTERLNERDIHIDRQHLGERKHRQMNRMHAMFNYVSESSECRSQILLHYFGEEITHRCGICDYCLSRNKLGVSDLEFSNACTQVQSLLADTPMQLQDVVHRIHD